MSSACMAAKVWFLNMRKLPLGGSAQLVLKSLSRRQPLCLAMASP